MTGKLMVVKCKFFSHVASILSPFLKKYQTNAPMLPFLIADVMELLKKLLPKILKPEVLQLAMASVVKLCAIDVYNKTNLISAKKVDVGFDVKADLQSAGASKGEAYSFRQGCKSFLQAAVSSIMDKSPNLWCEIDNRVWIQERW